MIIGVPTEVKKDESRIGLRPVGAEVLIKHGHQVFVQRDGGLGSGFSNAEYEAAGATLLDTAEEIWDKAEMIVKVKEPQPA